MKKYEISPQNGDFNNALSIIFKLLAGVAFIIAFGIFIGALNDSHPQLAPIAFPCGMFIGAALLLLALATVIELLNKIANQKYTISEIVDSTTKEPEESGKTEEA